MNKESFELKRKIFHIIGLIIPVIYYFNSKLVASILLTLLTAFVITTDIFRHKNSKIQYIINNFLGFLMRKSESDSQKLTGSSWMALGILISCILYDKYITILAWVILFVCDALAAIVGSRIGKNEIIPGKSYEGSAVFFMSSLFIGILYYQTIYAGFTFKGLILASFFSCLAEIYSKKYNVDDNLLIPIIAGFFLSIF